MKLPSSLAHFWDPRGATSRLFFALAGCGLMAVKFTLDRLTMDYLVGARWNWSNYWHPVDGIGHSDLAKAPPYLLLLLQATPFIATGIMLTLRRLRDAGWPLWLAVLFFVPALNMAFFILLCLTPSRSQLRDPLVVSPRPLGWLAQILVLKSPAASAAVAVVLTVLLTVPLTWLATACFKNYGWGIFVAMPFLLGMVAAILHSTPEPRTWASCVGVALLALVFCGLVILAVALEGALCLLMAAPLAAPIVILGATAGYYFQIARRGRVVRTTQFYTATWLALPFALGGERWMQVKPELIAVTTTVEIAAPPAKVWSKVVTFSELSQPRELVFRSGIAYPVRATIIGEGVGAVRHCEFSTGPFVEPITAWDEPHRLAFDVVEQPHPMREVSPYRALHPPHLDHFFRSRRGEFRLTALPDGRTRLDGTTWYTQQLWPARYWQGWSDYLVHTIHARVLEHIRTEAENAQ